MIIKRLRLENIRSYTIEEINFPESSTLLSGDIGSGKSTILLSIDFALFGLQKGVLNGSTLLRNGEKQGSVELYLKIDNKSVIIKRSLKREKTIKQDNGFIIIDDKKKELAPSDLKYEILNLLNYPKELLTKSKSLIYKYTVYTPQESMKEILLTDKDSRLDILRKVFDIDKYKRIKENSKIFIQKIKEKSKEFQGILQNLEQLKREKQQEDLNLKKIREELSYFKPLIEKKELEIKTQKEAIEELEDKIKQQIEIKKEQVLVENSIRHYVNNSENLKKEINELEKQLNQTELKEIKEIKKEEILNIENKIKELENNHKSINSRISELKTKKNNSEEIKEKVLRLNNCPLCLQEVTKEHKNKISEEENKKINQLSLLLESEINKEIKLQEETLSLKNNLETLKSEKQKFEINQIRIQNFKEKQEKIKKIEKNQLKIKEEISILNKKKILLNKNLEKFKDIETIFQEQKQEHDKLQYELNNLKIKQAEISTKINSLKEKIDYLKKEIGNKLKAKNNLNKLKKIQHYLDLNFSNLMDLMERQVMLKVYSDFNKLFQKWFNILINNENITVNLDKEFTPLIEQNEYETEFQNLSGGEKTSIALAYRLSLNQIINNLITNIKTKDLIILDEPTDGFSYEQLDRIKLLLDELNVKQIIIVSHEPKIESFVNHVISLKKEEHISKVVR